MISPTPELTIPWLQTMYGKDLVRDIKSETSGHYEDLLVRLMMDNSNFDAYCLHKAMKVCRLLVAGLLTVKE